MPASPDVLVIGGGVAGLSAAVDCASRGYSVVLAEERGHLGGRAWSFTDDETGDEVDNGQHLMLGCYHSTLRLMRAIGSDRWCSMLDPLALTFRDDRRSYAMRAPSLPPPLHALAALLGLKTLTLTERAALLRVAPALLSKSSANDARLDAMTVAEWLRRAGQSGDAQTKFWNILAVGMLNERPERASAAIFVRVLRTILLGSPADASVVLPRRGLSRIFGGPASDFICAHGGRVALQAPVTGVRIADGRVASVRLGGDTIEPRAVVSAVPHFAARRLFAGDAHIHLPMLGQVGRFEEVPIVSIHLWFDHRFMQEEYTALIGSPIDWVFNRTKIAAGDNAGGEGRMYLSCVVSAARDLAAKPKEDIIENAVREVKRFFPEGAQARLVHGLVVKEKRATFSPRSGVDAFRPSHRTGIGNLFIAGDWTDTKLPATIEGAAQSGYACAAAAHALLAGASGRKE